MLFKKMVKKEFVSDVNMSQINNIFQMEQFPNVITHSLRKDKRLANKGEILGLENSKKSGKILLMALLASLPFYLLFILFSRLLIVTDLCKTLLTFTSLRIFLLVSFVFSYNSDQKKNIIWNLK